jgi:hypothetical protein
MEEECLGRRGVACKGKNRPCRGKSCILQTGREGIPSKLRTSGLICVGDVPHRPEDQHDVAQSMSPNGETCLPAGVHEYQHKPLVPCGHPGLLKGRPLRGGIVLIVTAHDLANGHGVRRSHLAIMLDCVDYFTCV